MHQEKSGNPGADSKMRHKNLVKKKRDLDKMGFCRTLIKWSTNFLSVEAKQLN
jgi:hypothetical protein